MTKKIIKTLKQNILVIWIVIAFLSLAVMFSMAAYPTLQNKAKKVIAVQADAEIQFSSNYLDTDIKYKTIVINDGDAIPVDIRNYSKSNSTRWYDSDIKYTIKATLTDLDGNIITNDSVIGNDNVIIKRVTTIGSTTTETTILTLDKNTKTAITSDVYDVSGNNSQVLVRNASDKTVNNYKVYFPSASSKVCVKLEATPAVEYRDLNSIGVILSVSDKSSIQGDGWYGRFSDPENKNPSEYDAFNYDITGHGDSLSATIQWNSNCISLNKAYLISEFGADPTTASDVDPVNKPGWKILTIPLESDHVNGRYAFQVFKSSEFSAFMAQQLSAWSSEYGTMDQGNEGFVTAEEYLWEKLNGCIIFDDGI